MRARDQLFAGAAFAGDEHVGLGLGEAVHEVGHSLHGRAGPDHARQLAGFHAAAKAAELVAHRAVAHGALHGQPQRIHRHRLGDEVVGPRAHGADGVFHASEAGHHDHHQIRTFGERCAAQIQAAHAFHVDVDEQHREVFLVEKRQCLVGIQSPGDAVPALRQSRFPRVRTSRGRHRPRARPGLEPAKPSCVRLEEKGSLVPLPWAAPVHAACLSEIVEILAVRHAHTWHFAIVGVSFVTKRHMNCHSASFWARRPVGTQNSASGIGFSSNRPPAARAGPRSVRRFPSQ